MHKTIKTIFALTLAVFAIGAFAASEKSKVMAPIQQFADGLNTGDVKSAVAACTDDMCIIDEVAPHEWHGAGACSKWLTDFDADAKKNGITDTHVQLKKPRHVDVTGDRAYVVVPADYTYKQHGKRMKEKGLLTIALQKTDAVWLVSGWAWSKQ
jgi:ketosteroid isomerase-like protein